MKKLFLNDKFICSLIAINGFIIFYLCYDHPPLYHLFFYFDIILTLLFLTEIAYKIYFYKKRFFTSKRNIFDFFIVSVSSIPFFLLVFDFNVNHLENLDHLLLLRMFRFFKLFRTMQIIPNVDKIYSDLKKAVKVTYGIMLGGFIILIIIGVMLCSVFKNFDPANFGDPIVSIYTAFRLFSVEGWYEIPDAMSGHTSYLNATLIRIIFSILVLFGMFILGFIISSITDELAIDNTKKLEDKIDELNEKIDLLLKNK